MSLFDILSFITEHPLNRSHRLSTLLRFLRWQISSRLRPGPAVVKWVNGARFYVRRGESALTGNLYTGLYEFQEMAFLLHFLRGEDLFADVGANAGSYTLLACAAIGARGIAFEPIPDTFERLVENVRLNGLEERVRCVNAAVGAQDGAIAFSIGSDTTNHALAPDERTDCMLTVPMTRLDTALREETPALLKIDVEGFETPVIQGAPQVLKRRALHAVIMELNESGARYGFDEAEILSMMRGYGFGTYAYEPFARRLIDLDGKNRDSGNTLFIRADSRTFVEGRVTMAPKFSILGSLL